MHAAPPLTVLEEERGELERMARSTTASPRLVAQARALLLASDGVANNEIARRMGVSSNSVREWRRRYQSAGLESVGVIARGRGRRPWLPEGTVAEIVRVTMREAPVGTSTRWTTRSLAERVGVGKDTVARVWRDHGLEPWKTETFKISDEPAFETNLVDVVAEPELGEPGRAIARNDRRGVDRRTRGVSTEGEWII
jgi:transposase